MMRNLFFCIQTIFSRRAFFFVMHCLVFIPFLNPAIAQEVKSELSADTTTILIGQQFHLVLEVNHPANIKTEWPTLPDTFSNLEIVQRSKIDTILNKTDQTVTHKQVYVVTSFDTGFHVITPLQIQYRIPGDTSTKLSETKPLLITVNTIAVDTTRAIRDIKGQIEIPFTWKDALPYLLGVILLGLLGWIIFYYLKKRKRKVEVPAIVIPKRPAHEIALEALQQLDEAKLWQNGNFKGYYSALSDITKTFMDNRWSLDAMEMTTDEILSLKIIKDQPNEGFAHMKFLLELSDLVKFAKAKPVVYENEQCMQYAVDFVKNNQQAFEVKEVQR